MLDLSCRAVIGETPDVSLQNNLILCSLRSIFEYFVPLAVICGPYASFVKTKTDTAVEKKKHSVTKTLKEPIAAGKINIDVI